VTGRKCLNAVAILYRFRNLGYSIYSNLQGEKKIRFNFFSTCQNEISAKEKINWNLFFLALSQGEKKV